MFTYVVRAQAANAQVADRWLAWLLAGHLQRVLEAGALDAEVMREAVAADGTQRLEVRYHFRHAHAFEHYEKAHAPALRAELPTQFPEHAQVTLSRAMGEVVAKRP